MTIFLHCCKTNLRSLLQDRFKCITILFDSYKTNLRSLLLDIQPAQYARHRLAWPGAHPSPAPNQGRERLGVSEALLTDEYGTSVYRWWHLSGPGPELVEAIGDGWFPTAGRVLDLGCGAGSEAAALSGSDRAVVGIDLSHSALSLAHRNAVMASFVAADAIRLPFAESSFEAAIDRGCFHYLSASERLGYAVGLARVLHRDSPFLLRACLASAGGPEPHRWIDHRDDVPRMEHRRHRAAIDPQRHSIDARPCLSPPLSELGPVSRRVPLSRVMLRSGSTIADGDVTTISGNGRSG